MQSNSGEHPLLTNSQDKDDISKIMLCNHHGYFEQIKNLHVPQTGCSTRVNALQESQGTSD